VFAYRDPDLRIERVELLDAETAEFFETELQPVDAQTLAQETGAVAGQKVVVRLKPGLPQGRFDQRLRLHLNHADLGPLEVPVLGSIEGNVTFAGPGYDPRSRIWDLGKLPGDQDQTKTLWVIVTGEDAASVQFRVAEVDPSEVLRVELEPGTSSGRFARHLLRLTLHPQGRTINRLGSDQGPLAEVVLETTQADAPRVRIPIAFALGAPAELQ
jgi:hypothetical protein